MNETWDLDSIFEGGAESKTLAQFLASWRQDLAAFSAKALPGSLNDATQQAWVRTIETVYELNRRMHQASAFSGCLVSQNVKDEAALQLRGDLDQDAASLRAVWTKLEASFAEQDDDAWDKLMASPELAPISFALNELRDTARQKMNAELETLLSDLATDGYHAWGRLYGIISSDKQVEFDGETLSLGQLQNRYEDHPDRSVRERAFALYEQSFNELSKSCGLALNYQAGFRLTTYRHRGWDSFLKEPLMRNRMTAETLDTMWGVIDDNSARLLAFFAAKAKLMGVEQLRWFDATSPVGKVERTFSYEEAADFVVDNIRAFNPDIADFCRMAVDKRWVEAENRPGKRAGAFCTSLPMSAQSRIFMTYNGSYNGMLTLAHELGHGYHGYVMRDLPYGARSYTMSIAETASTFNETVVNHAGLASAGSDQERLSILGTRLNDATTFLMNIRARFDFERAFFEKRAKGQLPVAELNALMEAAQRNAYKNGLADYHPLFWASKLHFYNTGAPFYNFPYTFGYLFSTGVYAQAKAEGASFQQRYISMLRDTGSMNTEDLAATHLGVDLTKPAFWQSAVDAALAPIDEFAALAEKLA